MKRNMLSIVCSILILSLPFAASAAPTEHDSASRQALDTVWLASAAALVFFMQAGFALLESGMARAKNSVNVVMKNYLDVCVGALAYWTVGFGLMFGINSFGLFGSSAFMLQGASNGEYSFLLFQTMFAATAATIASGAMAERARFSTYLFGSIVITAVIYPVFGSWAWGSFYEGKGWLAERGFIDFAGSTVVHSLGGWCALAAIIVLGPRLGRFDAHGNARDIPGHNLNLVALGGFILWFGWFGFNGGSTLAGDTNIGLINLNTQLAAAAGAIAAVLMCRTRGAPILVSEVVNGSLAGLVGITAGCATMEPPFAVLTGFSASVMAQLATPALLRLGLDDVVGAVAVHGVAGAWGTLCAGFFLRDDMFNLQQLAVQFVGVLACFFWAFGSGLLIFKLLDVLLGLRAESLHEQRGLDFTEHYELAYPEFMREAVYTRESVPVLHKEIRV